VKEQINKIINQVVGDRIEYFPDQEGLLDEIAERLDKAIGIDEEKVWCVLIEANMCKPNKEDCTFQMCNHWGSCCVMAEKITQSRPLKCEVESEQ
jgi:hypothetical protein